MDLMFLTGTGAAVPPNSLGAWSPFGREHTEYVLQQVASAAERRRRAPELVDRRALVMAFLGSGSGESAGRVVRRQTSRSLRAENARRAREIAELKNELKEKRFRQQKTTYEKQIDIEYRILNNEFNALKGDSLRILSCGVGDREIDVRILANLNKFEQFFNQKLSQINSDASTWSIQYKTYLLEHLKKLYTQHISQVDELINMIIETN